MEIGGIPNSLSIYISFDKNETQSSILPKQRIVPFEQNQNQQQSEKNISPKNQNVDFSIKKELTPEEKKRVEELKRIDAKVRAHEMAHLSAGGGLVRGGANFTYEVGPDGKAYAVAGEVKIDMSADPDDPEKTIQKMQQVRRAALAPADPSPQDRSVAQQASNIEAQMRAKILQERSKTKDIISIYKKNDFHSSAGRKFENQDNLSLINNSLVSLKRKVNFSI
ncbi:MAG: putative metalloprotease CJM1_0395 family protein [Candidatus Kapaibacteriales bacterium]